MKIRFSSKAPRRNRYKLRLTYWAFHVLPAFALMRDDMFVHEKRYHITLLWLLWQWTAVECIIEKQTKS